MDHFFTTRLMESICLRLFNIASIDFWEPYWKTTITISRKIKTLLLQNFLDFINWSKRMIKDNKSIEAILSLWLMCSILDKRLYSASTLKVLGTADKLLIMIPQPPKRIMISRKEIQSNYQSNIEKDWLISSEEMLSFLRDTKLLTILYW